MVAVPVVSRNASPVGCLKPTGRIRACEPDSLRTTGQFPAGPSSDTPVGLLFVARLTLLTLLILLTRLGRQLGSLNERDTQAIG